MSLVNVHLERRLLLLVLPENRSQCQARYTSAATYASQRACETSDAQEESPYCNSESRLRVRRCCPHDTRWTDSSYLVRRGSQRKRMADSVGISLTFVLPLGKSSAELDRGRFCRVRGELFSLDDIRAPCSMKPAQADREVQGDLTRAVLSFFGRPKIHRCLGTLTNTRRCAQTRRAVRKTSVASCILAFACNPPRELQEVSAFTRHHRIALRSHGGARTGMVPPSMFR